MTSSSSTLLKEQVLAWLHGDNESVVTCQTIQQDGRCYEDTAGEDDDDADTGHAVSRYEGSQLLAEIYRNGRKTGDNNTSDAYIATLCTKRDYITPVTPDSTGGVAHDYKTTVYELKASNDDEIRGDVEMEKFQLATPSTTTTVFALQAAASLDTLEMKHESDEGFLRDLINEHDNSAWYYDNAHLCRIGPSPRIMASMDTKPAELIEKTWRKVEKKTNLATSTQRGKKRGGGSGGKFFSNTDGGGVNHSTKTTTVTKTMTKGSTGRNVEKKTNHTSRNKKIPSAFAQRTTSAMTRPPTAFAASSSSSQSQSQSQSVVAVCSREKLEQAKQKKQKMTVGTVDDFKGDVDEDSEDEYDMEQRRAKSTKIQEQQSRLDAILNEENSVSGAEDNTSSDNQNDADEDDNAEARKTPSTSNRNTTTKKKSVKVIDEDEDNDVIQYDDGPSSGGGTYRPMDAFAVKTNKKKLAHEEDTTTSSGVPKKKKRKIFKDTTTMNKQGFMVTTTEEVWEEIEEEEEKEEDPQPKQSSSSTATTNTKATKSTIHSTKFGKINIKKKQASTGMKQGTMASFFSVKKKK